MTFASELDAYEAHAETMMWRPSEPLHQRIADRVLRAFTQRSGIVPNASRLLEVGAGAGRIARAAVEQGWAEYVAVEPTKVFADALRDVDPRVTVVDAALPDLPNDLDGLFDAVITLHVIEHAQSPESAREWMEALARCLKPGGSMLVVAPDIRDYRFSFWDADWSHGWPTTPARIAELVESVGLETTTVNTMRLTLLSPWSVLTLALSALLPTRPIDSLTRRLMGRPLASGIKMALFWGQSFVIARSPTTLGASGSPSGRTPN